ncbi:MAG: oligosaccharide flippase family protein [Armatimonadia bacterium]
MASAGTVSERAVKDTAKQFGSQLAVGLFAVFFAAWLNRLLPARELAVWPLCLSLGAAVAAVASFGLGDTFIRLVPAMVARGEQDEAARLLKTGLLVNLSACLGLSVVVYLLSEQTARYLLHDEAMTSLVRGMAPAAFFIACSERLNWAMQAVQEFGRRALINGLTGIIRTPLALGLCLLLHSPRGVILALTFTPLLSCLLSVLWLWPHLRRGAGFTPVGQVLSFSLPYYGVSLIGLICGRMNQLIIALFVAPEVLATYFVAGSISGYVSSLDRFAIEATTPKLSEKGALAAGIHETEAVFRKCTRYVFLGLIPLHFLVAVAATPLLQLYGGSQYAGAGPVLAVLCMGLLFVLLYDLQRAHIQVFAEPLHLLWLSVSQSLVNIILLVLLVPALGALGAALVDALVGLSLLIVSALMLRRTMVVRYDLQALWIALSASLAAAAILWLLHPLWQQHASPVLLALALAGVIYGLALARRLHTDDVTLFIRCLPARMVETETGQALGRSLSWLWTKPA